MTSTNNIISHLIFLGLTLTLVGIASATTTTTITKTTYTYPATGNTDATKTTKTTTYTSPTTETTDASPTTENTDASPTTEKADASPTNENTDASPTTEKADASPTTENTYASPSTENTYASPSTENTDASPTTENSSASPTTENSYGLAMTKETPKEYLAAHNKVRAEANEEPLTWNETLVAYAQKYANTRIATCDMVHSDGPYGENLAMGYEEMTAEKAVTLWCEEKKFYNHETNKCGDDPNHCLHYTQVVWKDTKSVGCAQVKCQNKWVFLICNYYPPGNVIGQRPY